MHEINDLYRAADYWKWIYTCKYIQYQCPYLIRYCDTCMGYLMDFIKSDHKLIEELLLGSSIYNYPENNITKEINKFTKQIPEFSEEQEYALLFLSSFAHLFGYFYHDMFFYKNIDLLLDHYIQYEQFPFSPHPFPASIEQIARLMSVNPITISRKIGNNLKIENINLKLRSVWGTDKSEKDNDQILDFTNYIFPQVQQLAKKFSVTNDDNHFTFKLLNKRKKFIRDEYSLKSNYARMIGLFSYEFKNKYKIDNNAIVLDRILDSKYIDKLDHISKLFSKPQLRDFELSYLARLISKTSKCINSISVLSLK